MMKLYGGIEAGGTKFNCVIGSGPDHIVAEARIATTTPTETIGHTIDFFQRHASEHPVSAVGIGSFGPVDLDRASATYGHITTTPKPGWAQADLCGAIQRALQVPVAFDTDVNAAAFGEHHWVIDNRTRDPLLYLTIGTGIGLGAIVNGKPLHGLLHPEAGHMLLPHDRAVDPFEGACPFHGDCWEGLAAGPAVEKRWQQRGETLPPDHSAWQLEAHYVALAVVNLIYAFSPQRVVIGGGVMQQAGLIDRVRGEAQNLINGYLQSDRITHDIDQLIVPPGLGNRSGVLGAIALAATLDAHQQPH
jgi:fructokinase